MVSMDSISNSVCHAGFWLVEVKNKYFIIPLVAADQMIKQL